MTRAAAIVIGAVLSLATLAGAPGAAGRGQDQAPTFRATTDLVRVDVSVRDRARVVLGLLAKDFAVSDNGVPQQISEVAYEKLPIDVTIALDLSYSVTGELLDRLRRAIGQLMRDLGKDDRLKLITFNMRVARVSDFTTDAAAVERAIRTASAGGGTSIYDALSVALASVGPSDRRQLVVVFTDGRDSLSVTEPAALLEVGQRANATVTAVITGEPGQSFTAVNSSGVVFQGTRLSAPPRGQAAILSRLAAESGGLTIPVIAAGQDLTGTFRRALDEFRSSYVLYFAPRGVDRGGFHTLQVSVPGRNALTIRARRGYWRD